MEGKEPQQGGGGQLLEPAQELSGKGGVMGG